MTKEALEKRSGARIVDSRLQMENDGSSTAQHNTELDGEKVSVAYVQFTINGES